MKVRLLATTFVLVCACAHGTKSKSTASQEPAVSRQDAAGTTSEIPTSSTSMGEARPDKVVAARLQMDDAIAPFVADALASYPQARARFLAGLPKGQRLLVVFRLPRTDGTFEQVFLHCHRIEDGTIEGILASKVKRGDLAQGSSLRIEEKDILDWVIVHADGKEEGNRVGRFLEEWKGRQFFGVLFAMQRIGDQVHARYLHVLDGTPKGKLNFDPPSVFLEAAIAELNKKPVADFSLDDEVYTYILYWPLEPTALHKEPERKP